MSRKNAANFSMGNASQQYHRYTIPKSRSENFIDYMKSTGYELPRHFNASHCDFLFQDPELFDCAKFLMGKAKRTVGEHDLKRFENLLENGEPLSKSQLSLVEMEKNEVLVNISEAKKKISEEIDVLNTEVDEARSRINQWNKVKSMHGSSLEAHKSQKLSERCQNEALKRRNDGLNHEFLEKRVLFRDEIRLTQEVLSKSLNSLKPSKNEYEHNTRENLVLCQFDCIAMKNEDDFFSLLRSTAENYGTGLVGKSEVFDPLATDEFAKECTANVTDVERLRAAILYEFERKIRLRAALNKYSCIDDCLNGLIASARRISLQSPQIQMRLMDDTQKRIHELSVKTKALKKLKLGELYETKLGELNGQIKVVQDLKAMANVKENQFFGVVSKMLRNQRARLEIGMHLMKTRNTRISEVIDAITQFRQQLRKYQQLDNCLNPNSLERHLSQIPQLHSSLTKNSIPASALSCYESRWKALVIVDRNGEIERLRKSISDEQKTDAQMKRITDSILTAGNRRSFISSSSKDAEKSENCKDLNVLIKNNQDIKIELNKHQETRETLITEAIGWKRSKCADINAFLDSLPRLGLN